VKLFGTDGVRGKAGVKVGENCRLIDVRLGSEPYLIKLGNLPIKSEYFEDAILLSTDGFTPLIKSANTIPELS